MKKETIKDFINNNYPNCSDFNKIELENKMLELLDMENKISGVLNDVIGAPKKENIIVSWWNRIYEWLFWEYNIGYFETAAVCCTPLLVVFLIYLTLNCC